MAYEKLLATDARDKFNEAVGLSIQATNLAKANPALAAQIRAIDAYAMALLLNSRTNTKGINDILERLDRIEQALTNKHGMITTLR
jgi:hypothetical protein